MHWDMLDFEESERVRAAFQGELRYGTYYNGTFVSLEQEVGKPEPPKVLYTPQCIYNLFIQCLF